MSFKRNALWLAAGLATAAAIALAADVRAPYINGGSLTANAIVTATSDGLGIQTGGIQATNYARASWVTGMTLQNVAIPLAFVPTASTATGATCRPEVLTGGTSTANIKYAASGTSCASGTTINTSPCNGNVSATTHQSLSITTASIPANSDICVVFSNDAAWTSTPGIGNIQLGYTSP
jgi:hypothetical protein